MQSLVIRYYLYYNFVTMRFFNIQTFGCQMNVHESEKIAGSLVEAGYQPTDSVADADVIVFNTCCIRDTAEKRIMGNIGAVKPLKKADRSKIVAVVGCMTQQDGMKEAIFKKFPFVDIILGTDRLDRIGEYVERVAMSNGKRPKIDDVHNIDTPEIIENTPIFRTSGTNAWVNIMYGCNNFCTYCIVPYVRGRERSRDPETVVGEVRGLIEEGYREITLLGQNVDSYGNDRQDGWNFAKLMRAIDGIDGKFRVRFMTSHPKDISEEVIDFMAESVHFCHNIHLPVQAGSNRVLQAMNRKYTREHYLYLIDRLRAAMPDVGITTDIMVGFPGETEEDFQDTLRLVEQVRFSNAFTFIYSPRNGTVAAKMEQIPYAVKKERIGRLIVLQNSITKEISDRYVGTILEILVEDAPKPDLLCGRSDSGRLVNFPGSADRIGEFVRVRIDKSRSASLWGEIV